MTITKTIVFNLGAFVGVVALPFTVAGILLTWVATLMQTWADK